MSVLFGLIYHFLDSFDKKSKISSDYDFPLLPIKEMDGERCAKISLLYASIPDLKLLSLSMKI